MQEARASTFMSTVWRYKESGSTLPHPQENRRMPLTGLTILLAQAYPSFTRQVASIADFNTTRLFLPFGLSDISYYSLKLLVIVRPAERQTMNLLPSRIWLRIFSMRRFNELRCNTSCFIFLGLQFPRSRTSTKLCGCRFKTTP